MSREINKILKRALKEGFDLKGLPDYSPRKFINSLYQHLVENHFIVYEENNIMYVGYNIIDDVAKITVFDTTMRITPLQEEGFFDILIELFKYISIAAKITLLDKKSEEEIIELSEKTGVTEVYLTSFLNSYLVWNTGIAFGLFSLSDELTYNLFTALIVLINLIIIYLAVVTKDFRKYFFLLILGGSFGNLFDRLFYGSVPDFIDFHIGNFHWFIFNIADIFITVGVICLILAEVLYKKDTNE